nr:unnamed protein product [Spirometra erinaceieuropaei]
MVKNEMKMIRFLKYELYNFRLSKIIQLVLRSEALFNATDAKPVNVIAVVESDISQTESTDEFNWLIRHKIPSLLMVHRPREMLPKVERAAPGELKADKCLVVVSVDRGRLMVILDETDYLQNVKRLLEDCQSCGPCAPNLVKMLTREIYATLSEVENSGAISPVDRRMARAQDMAFARYYGHSKVHKVGVPLRPIVSLKATTAHGLAKWLFRCSDRKFGHYSQFFSSILGFDETIYDSRLMDKTVESPVFRHHRSKFWARHIDHTFVVIERDQVLAFKERLNAVNADMKFAMEEEANN